MTSGTPKKQMLGISLLKAQVVVLLALPLLAAAPVHFTTHGLSLNVAQADDDGGGGGGGGDDDSSGGVSGFGGGNSGTGDNYGGGGYGGNDQTGGFSNNAGGYSGGSSAAASSQSDQAAAAAAADTAENTQAQAVTTHAATNATAGMGGNTAGDDDTGSMARGVAAQRGGDDDDTTATTGFSAQDYGAYTTNQFASFSSENVPAASYQGVNAPVGAPDMGDIGDYGLGATPDTVADVAPMAPTPVPGWMSSTMSTIGGWLSAANDFANNNLDVGPPSPAMMNFQAAVLGAVAAEAESLGPNPESIVGDLAPAEAAVESMFSKLGFTQAYEGEDIAATVAQIGPDTKVFRAGGFNVDGSLSPATQTDDTLGRYVGIGGDATTAAMYGSPMVATMGDLAPHVDGFTLGSVDPYGSGYTVSDTGVIGTMSFTGTIPAGVFKSAY